MVNKIFSKGRRILTQPQSTILSAATVIMLMIVASRILGLIRQRTLAHFFGAEELSLFFAAFRLPDLVFEVLVFGTFSSAFIPVFAKKVAQDKEEAWRVAAVITNIGLLLFASLALILSFSASPLYSLIAPGFSLEQRDQIIVLTRILFFSQGFFVISYVLTGVLESLRRFLVPALAPLFYNLGIILGTLFLSQSLGLLGPAIGVLIGAFSHFAIQLPLAWKMGFRFKPTLRIDSDVKKIGKLALPRVIEVSFLQISKSVELFLASLISTASYTYFTFATTLQLLPVGLFGTSIAKAALPTLAASSDNKKLFTKTLSEALSQMTFLMLPVATILFVLRIPIVRLVFGTEIFTWESTVQTSLAVSAFAIGVVFQAAAALLSRAFYALHDTKTPVIASVFSIFIVISLDILFIRVLHLPVWGLAAAVSIGSFLQSSTLFFLIQKRLNGSFSPSMVAPFFKSGLAALGSGTFMYFILKVFDRSVWVKRLSFMEKIDSAGFIPFERFVLDTSYSINVLALTMSVSLAGVIIYILLSLILKNNEVWTLFSIAKKVLIKRKVGPLPAKKQEPVTPTPGDSTSS